MRLIFPLPSIRYFGTSRLKDSRRLSLGKIRYDFTLLVVLILVFFRSLHNYIFIFVFFVVQEGKKTIPGKNNEFVLKNLEGSTMYFVQVQAMIQYGQRKLRSKKTHVVITTHDGECF